MPDAALPMPLFRKRREGEASLYPFTTKKIGSPGEARSTEELEVLLAEKEIVLRETHHRIKNDMAIIASYLALRADSLAAGRPERQILLEARSNVDGMTRLYDRLYRSEDFRTVSAKPYIKELIDEICSLVPRPAQFAVVTDCDDVALDSHMLFLLGMAVNELIINAIKHAFPDGRGGTVRFALKRGSGEALIMEVEDDGVGLPDDTNFKSGFGLTLVPALAAQIGGTFEKASVPNKGAWFRIYVPKAFPKSDGS